MGHKKSLLRIIFEIFNTILLASLAAACLIPLLHVFFSSISNPSDLIVHSGVVLWPLGKATLKGYELVFQNSKILTGYGNTLYYVAASTAIGMTLTIIAGYVLSRRNLLLRNFIMFYITFTMLFNGGLIPFYLVVKNLGGIDKRWAVIIPTCLSVFNIILMRTSMMSIPVSLEESAKIEGAGHFRILFQIILPLSKAVTAALILFYAVAHWNSWFGAMIFLQTKSKFPLQLILREILVQSDISNIMQGSSGVTSAQLNLGTYKLLVQHSTTIVATVPILIIYPFVQKYFVAGVMIGSLKE